MSAPAQQTEASWQELLERRVSTLPGVELQETTKAGSRIYVAGHYRLVIPSRGDAAIRRQTLRAFDHWHERYQRWRSQEFGTRPSDVEHMRPIEPTADTAADLSLVTTTQEPPMTTKTAKAYTYSTCPVDGCGKIAAGPHIAAHKRRGELAADYKLGPAASELARHPNAGTRRGRSTPPPPEPVKPPRVVLGAVVRRQRDEFETALKDVKTAVGMLQDALTKLHDGPVAGLLEFTDRLMVENTHQQRELEELRTQVGMIRNAVTNATEGKNGALRAGIPVR